MTILETAKMTSKGQVTIPNRIRKLLHLKQGEAIGFSVTKGGIVLVPCQITGRSPYTPNEWQKIEKLALEEGKVCATIQSAKEHLKSL